jgi:hypothetical protein
MQELSANQLREFAARLQSIPEFTRKLFAHIVELAYAQHHEERVPGVAYLPELHETSGLDVESMYDHLHRLQRAGLIELECQYPFEDVRVAGTGPAILHSRFEAQGKSFRDAVVQVQWDGWQ